LILITGATGTVGKEVVKRLSAKAVPVRAVTRDPRKAAAESLPHVQFVEGDFDDPESMRRACAGVDRAFLLTNSTERAEEQQIAFARVAQQSGVRHLVKLSQLHADTNAPGRFLRYHAAVEAAVRASGLTFTFLRPNLYMQGLLNFRQSIQEQSAFFVTAGEARISAVDVRDIADVGVAALTTVQHDNKSYALTGPEALTFAEMGTSYRGPLAARLRLSMCRLRRCGRRWRTWVSRRGRRTVCSKSSRCTVVARRPGSNPACVTLWAARLVHLLSSRMTTPHCSLEGTNQAPTQETPASRWGVCCGGRRRRWPENGLLRSADRARR
jgi:uncharacterized protein YbjT (DUF2867 family)